MICPEDVAATVDATAATVGGIRVVTAASTGLGTSVAAGAAVLALPLLVESDYGGSRPGPAVTIQAQGDGLQKSATAQGGAQGQVSGVDGAHALAALVSTLTPAEAQARDRSLQRVARFIQNAAAGGGTVRGASFPMRPGKDAPRIDVEVRSGTVFTPGARTDASITTTP